MVNTTIRQRRRGPTGVPDASCLWKAPWKRSSVCRWLNGKAIGLIVALLVVGGGFAVLTSLSPEQQKALLYFTQDYLPIAMFCTLGMLLFSGYPVAFILGGLALLYGLIGYMLGVFSLIEFFNFLPRIWGQAAENLVLVAVPAFVFMGIMMERSGIANDLLYTVQVLLKRVPGALALAVTIMGTILAAMTGIIGASVTMMTALALPTMMRQGYSHALACGTIAASGTLGILIPPSIMLIIMADLMSVSVGNVFMAAWGPGLCLVALYVLFVVMVATVKPDLAPKLPPNLLHVPRGELGPLVLRAFIPPVFLIGLIKGAILFGWSTPSEAGAVGAFGAMMLAWFNGRLNYQTLEGVCHSAGRTVAMIFFIIISATCFAYVYRSLGGDVVVDDLITSAGFGSWGLLFLIMGIVFVLGFFLDWIEITLIVLPVFAPMVAGLDFGDHVAKQDMVLWFIILMAVNLQTSFLTPPFGFALFYLKGIAPREIKIQSIYLGNHSVRPAAAERADRRHALSERRALADAFSLRNRRAAIGLEVSSMTQDSPTMRQDHPARVHRAQRSADRDPDQRRPAQLRRLRRPLGGMADRAPDPDHGVRRHRAQADLDPDLAGPHLRPDLRIDPAPGARVALPHCPVRLGPGLRLHLQYPRAGRSDPRDPVVPQEGLARVPGPDVLPDSRTAPS